MCRALAVVAGAFASRGHLLNLGVTKTAALLTNRGKGAKKAKQHAWRERGGHVVAQTQHLGTIRAPIVKRYVHLGSVILSIPRVTCGPRSDIEPAVPRLHCVCCEL
eukprot:9335659-Pyramimonas_sp.AAC.1